MNQKIIFLMIFLFDRLLIEGGADVNEESSQGTALHLASLYGKIEVVSLLLEVLKYFNRKCFY